MDLSTRNLEQALSIRRQIDALERRLRGLVRGCAATRRQTPDVSRGSGEDRGSGKGSLGTNKRTHRPKGRKETQRRNHGIGPTKAFSVNESPVGSAKKEAR